MLPEKTTVLGKNVAYVKLHGYNQNYLYPILKGFGHNVEKEFLLKNRHKFTDYQTRKNRKKKFTCCVTNTCAQHIINI